MPVESAPTWTNPLVGMLALISATHAAYGPESLHIMSEGMKLLGRRTGQSMLEHGLIAAGCSPAEWGRFTHQLMDLTGMHTYYETAATEAVYEFVVPSAAWPYHDPQAYLDSPPEWCEIQADWDRGCLQTINPQIAMTQPKCSARGDDECLWRYELV